MLTKGKGPFDPAKVFQEGIVVKSVDETVKYYQDVFGFGPFRIIEVNYPNATYFGKVAGYRGKRGFGTIGPITIELIELIDGKTIHETFLKEKGEGLNHLGFEVEDLTKAIEDAEKQGLKVIQSYRREDGSGFAYLNSDRVGGVVFEMIQRSKPAK
jgi:4-hydroxyphenylpyruvate dioxygenase-like putative hemolysin